MRAFPLYARYALRSFIRGRTRSLFGAFCVAVGIASVVALGLVAGNFHDSVTGDARRLNRGDVSASPAGMGFTLQQMQTFARLKAHGDISDCTVRLQDDTALRGPTPGGASTVGSLVGVDPRVFPFYDTIKADRPTGEPLSTLLARPYTAAVSQDTLDTLHLRVGDRITINSRHGFNHQYTIAGVVPDSAVNPFFGAGFWNDFAMVDQKSIAPFFRGLDVSATTVYIKTSQPERVKREIGASLGNLTTIKTASDVAKEQENSAAGFDKFFRIMGLVAVIIGGIGIVNTMLVAARRRTREISVLKSLGMKGRQVVLIFSLEALVLAVAGTAMGILAGIGLSLLVNAVTENLAGTPIPWTLQLGPIVAGALVGIVGTVLFAYMPVLAASRARPVAALRGDLGGSIRRPRFREFLRALRRRPLSTLGRGLASVPMGVVRLPSRPGVRSAVTTLVLAALMGYLGILYAGLAGGTQAVVMGIAAGIGTLVAAGIMTQIFVVLVWLVSHLPTLGRLSVRMALRSMGTQKRRLGSTMFALCVGMLAVGAVAILAQNLRTFASAGATQQIGLNGLVEVPQQAPAISAMQRESARLPGVEHRELGAVANGARIVSIDGKRPQPILQRLAREKKLDPNSLTSVEYDLQGVEGRDLRVGRYDWRITAGRNLGPRDVGTNHIVVMEDLKHVGARVGSRIVFQDGGRDVPFTVVGLASSNSFTVVANNVGDATYLRRAGLATPGPSHLAVLYLKMRDNAVKSNLSTLRRRLPGTLVLDLSNFTVMIDKTIDKLALFPEIIGALALFAGVIIIANTVALAMLERRREIGVMKAVGARRHTIVRFLLVENAVVGFLGAAAGVGLSLIATALVDAQFLKIGTSVAWPTVAALIALGMLLAMSASALTALPASSERPMTVLRYE